MPAASFGFSPTLCTHLRPIRRAAATTLYMQPPVPPPTATAAAALIYLMRYDSSFGVPFGPIVGKRCWILVFVVVSLSISYFNWVGEGRRGEARRGGKGVKWLFHELPSEALSRPVIKSIKDITNWCANQRVSERQSCASGEEKIPEKMFVCLFIVIRTPVFIFLVARCTSRPTTLTMRPSTRSTVRCCSFWRLARFLFLFGVLLRGRRVASTDWPATGAAYGRLN